jgi:hypothetical protein
MSPLYNVGLGLTGYLGFGKETAYGTPVTRTNFLEINSEDINVEEGVVESAALASVGIRNTKRAQGAVSVAGNFEFDAPYAGWERLASQLMGSISSQQPDPTNYPTVWDHTISIADQLPVSTTVEVFRGTENFVTEPNKAFIYDGCVLTQGQFSCKVDDLLKVSFSLMGRQETRLAKSTPSYPSDPLAVYHQGGVTWNGEDAEVSEFSINFNNNMEMRPKLGSRFTRQPVRSGKLTVDCTFTAEFTSWARYDEFRNATERAFIADFVGALIGGVYYKRVRFSLPIGIINAHKVNLRAPGRLEATVSFRAYRDNASTNEMTIIFRNTQTASMVN